MYIPKCTYLFIYIYIYICAGIHIHISICIGYMSSVQGPCWLMVPQAVAAVAAESSTAPEVKTNQRVRVSGKNMGGSKTNQSEIQRGMYAYV